MYLLKKRIPYYLSILYIHLKEYFLMTSLRARKIEFSGNSMFLYLTVHMNEGLSRNKLQL